MDEKALENIWSQHYSDKGSFEDFKLAIDDTSVENIWNQHYKDKGSLDDFKLALGFSTQDKEPVQEEPKSEDLPNLTKISQTLVGKEVPEPTYRDQSFVDIKLETIPEPENQKDILEAERYNENIEALTEFDLSKITEADLSTKEGRLPARDTYRNFMGVNSEIEDKALKNLKNKYGDNWDEVFLSAVEDEKKGQTDSQEYLQEIRQDSDFNNLIAAQTNKAEISKLRDKVWPKEAKFQKKLAETQKEADEIYRKSLKEGSIKRWLGDRANKVEKAGLGLYKDIISLTAVAADKIGADDIAMKLRVGEDQFVTSIKDSQRLQDLESAQQSSRFKGEAIELTASFDDNYDVIFDKKTKKPKFLREKETGIREDFKEGDSRLSKAEGLIDKAKGELDVIRTLSMAEDSALDMAVMLAGTKGTTSALKITSKLGTQATIGAISFTQMFGDEYAQQLESGKSTEDAGNIAVVKAGTMAAIEPLIGNMELGLLNRGFSKTITKDFVSKSKDLAQKLAGDVASGKITRKAALKAYTAGAKSFISGVTGEVFEELVQESAGAMSETFVTGEEVDLPTIDENIETALITLPVAILGSSKNSIGNYGEAKKSFLGDALYSAATNRDVVDKVLSENNIKGKEAEKIKDKVDYLGDELDTYNISEEDKRSITPLILQRKEREDKIKSTTNKRVEDKLQKDIVDINNKIEKVTNVKLNEDTKNIKETPDTKEDKKSDKLVKTTLTYETEDGQEVDLGQFEEGEIVSIQGGDHKYNRGKKNFKDLSSGQTIGILELGRNNIIPQKKQVDSTANQGVTPSGDADKGISTKEGTTGSTGEGTPSSEVIAKLEDQISTLDNTIKDFESKGLDTSNLVGMKDSAAKELEALNKAAESPKKTEVVSDVTEGEKVPQIEAESLTESNLGQVEDTPSGTITTEITESIPEQVQTLTKEGFIESKNKDRKKPISVDNEGRFIKSDGKPYSPKFQKQLESEYQDFVKTQTKKADEQVPTTTREQDITPTQGDAQQQTTEPDAEPNGPVQSSEAGVGTQEVSGQEQTSLEQDRQTLQEDSDTQIEATATTDKGLKEQVKKFGFAKDDKTATGLVGLTKSIAKMAGKKVQELIPAIGKTTPKTLKKVDSDVKTSILKRVPEESKKVAQQMLDDGLSRDFVFANTGVYQKDNGELVYETGKLKLAEGVTLQDLIKKTVNLKGDDIIEVPLSGIINTDEELFTIYPQLKEIKVGLYGERHSDAPNIAGYDTEVETLDINPKGLLEYIQTEKRRRLDLQEDGILLGIISHELQHAVQSQEGRPNGTSTKQELKKLEKEAERYLRDNGLLEGQLTRAEKKAATVSYIRGRYIDPRGESFIRYFFNEGELEARVAQRRQETKEGSIDDSTRKELYESYTGLIDKVKDKENIPNDFIQRIKEMAAEDSRLTDQQRQKIQGISTKFSQEGNTPQTLDGVVDFINQGIKPHIKGIIGRIDKRLKEGNLSAAERKGILEQKKVLRDILIEHSTDGKIRNKYSKEKGSQYYGAVVQNLNSSIILALTDNAGPNTFVHELWHAGELFFSPEQKQFLVDQYNKWAKENGKKPVKEYNELRGGEPAVSEWGARAYENYFTEDRNFDNVDETSQMSAEERKTLKEIFNNLTDAIKEIVKTLKTWRGAPVTLTPELRTFFDDITAGRNPYAKETKTNTNNKTKKDGTQKEQAKEQKEDDLQERGKSKEQTLQDESEGVLGLRKLTNAEIDSALKLMGKEGLGNIESVSYLEAIKEANKRGYLSRIEEGLPREKEIAFSVLEGNTINEFQEIALQRALAHYSSELDINRDALNSTDSVNRSALLERESALLDEFEFYSQAYRKAATPAARLLAYRALSKVSKFNELLFIKDIEKLNIPKKEEARIKKMTEKARALKKELGEAFDKEQATIKSTKKKEAKDTLASMKASKKPKTNPVNEFQSFFKLNKKIRFSSEGTDQGSRRQQVIFDYAKHLVREGNISDIDTLVNRILEDYKKLGETKFDLTEEHIIHAVASGNPRQTKREISEYQKNINKLKSVAKRYKKISDIINGSVGRGKKTTKKQISNLGKLIQELQKIHLSQDFGFLPEEQERHFQAMVRIQELYTQNGITDFNKTSAKELVDAAARLNNQKTIDRLQSRIDDLNAGILPTYKPRDKKSAEDTEIFNLQAKLKDLRYELLGEQKKAELLSELRDKYGDRKIPGLGSLAEVMYNKKVIFGAGNLWELPRRYIFGGDISMMLIQGGLQFFNTVTTTMNPINYRTPKGRDKVRYNLEGLKDSWSNMFKAFWLGARKDKEFATDVYREIMNSPEGVLAKQMGVEITQPFRPGDPKSEEFFRSEGLGDLKGNSVVTSIVRDIGTRFDAISEGSFSAMLNTLRFNMFTTFRRMNPTASKAELIEYAKWINENTGRGNVKATGPLSQIFAAPRLYLSRLKVIAKIPEATLALRKNPNNLAARQILKDSTNIIIGFTIASLAMGLLGWDFEEDPRNKNFLKFVKGGQVIDLTAGVGKFLRVGIKGLTYTDEKVLGTNFVEDLLGKRTKSEKFNKMSDSPMALLTTTMKYSLHPAFGRVGEFFSGENIIGQPLGTSKSQIAYNMFITGMSPLGFQDLIKSDLRIADDRNTMDKLAEGMIKSAIQTPGINLIDYENNIRHKTVVDYMDSIDYSPTSTFTKKHVEQIFPELEKENIVNTGIRKTFITEVQDKVGTEILLILAKGKTPTTDNIKDIFEDKANEVAKIYERYYDLERNNFTKGKSSKSTRKSRSSRKQR